MTYAKVTAPVNKEKEADVNIHSAPADGPEICISEHNSYTYNRKFYAGTRGIIPSLSTFFSIAALCACSFIIGCSLSGSALCETLVSINTVAAGKISSGANYEPSDTDNTSVYKKYMLPDSIPEVNLDYLAANPYKSDTTPADSVTANTENDDKTTTVTKDAGGKYGSDGEVYYPVFARNLAADSFLTLSNQTSYTPDTPFLSQKTPEALKNLTINQDEPLVLILHTHGTECYSSCEKEGFYDKNSSVRNTDTSQNIVAIGKKINDVLNNFGIPSVHSEKMCDEESFVKAYSVSAAEAKAYLKKYPSIRIIIDLHRDSIEAEDGSISKPVFSHANEDVAQLMFVVGTDKAGANHPGWKENLCLALTVQDEISKDFPGLFRKINLRTASFNQQISPGYMLLECGAYANSFEEAEKAAEIFATGLARVIKKYAV